MLNQAEAQKIRQRRERWQEKASKTKERANAATIMTLSAAIISDCFMVRDKGIVYSCITSPKLS